jgi:hypothetical protein
MWARRTDYRRAYGHSGGAGAGAHYWGTVLRAELYRLKGELVATQSGVRHPPSAITSPQPPAPSTHAEAEAEACFHKAIEIARRQQGKSWELRAVMSLASPVAPTAKSRSPADAHGELRLVHSRALTPPTSRRPKHYWTSWRDKTIVHKTRLQQFAHRCHQDPCRGMIPTMFLVKHPERRGISKVSRERPGRWQRFW